MDSLKCQLWPHPSPYEASKVAPGGAQTVPPLSPLPISPLFFSHNKSGPDFPKQTALWGPSPPITLCQFQSGLKYDSTVCASRVSPLLPPPPSRYSYDRSIVSERPVRCCSYPRTAKPVRPGGWSGGCARSGPPFLTKLLPPFPSLPKLRQVIQARRDP